MTPADRDREYHRQLGAWLAHQFRLAGVPIRFVNCSYCDHGYERENGRHLIDGESGICILQTPGA